MSQETWTVGQLIEALSHFDPVLPVWTEGCDCEGNVAGLLLQRDAVLIERSN